MQTWMSSRYLVPYFAVSICGTALHCLLMRFLIHIITLKVVPASTIGAIVGALSNHRAYFLPGCPPGGKDQMEFYSFFNLAKDSITSFSVAPSNFNNCYMLRERSQQAVNHRYGLPGLLTFEKYCNLCTRFG